MRNETHQFIPRRVDNRLCMHCDRILDAHENKIKDSATDDMVAILPKYLQDSIAIWNRIAEALEAPIKRRESSIETQALAEAEADIAAGRVTPRKMTADTEIGDNR